MRNLLIAIVALACCAPAQAAMFSYGGSVFVDSEVSPTSIWLGDSESVFDFFWSPQPNRAYDFTLTLSRRADLAFVEISVDRSVSYQFWDSDEILRDDNNYSWDWQQQLAGASDATVLRGRYTPFTYTYERGKAPWGHWRQREWTYIHPGYADLYFASSGMLDYSVSISGPVPEPAAWTMMIAGFGLIGATLRRRDAVAVKFALA